MTILQQVIDFGTALSRNNGKLLEDLLEHISDEEYEEIQRVCDENNWDITGMSAVYLFHVYQQHTKAISTNVTNPDAYMENQL